MNLPIDKEYNNVYSFSKLSEQDTDEDRIKQHLYYDYTRVNGFQQLSSNAIEKTINLGFDLELYINYDADYSEIIKYNYCVLQDKKLGTNNQRKKYFYFISNIRQSNSAGKYKITLKYDYWSNNIAVIYLNNIENYFSFVRKTNKLNYNFSDGNINILIPENYRLSSVKNNLPTNSKVVTNTTINNFGYTILFAKIFLKQPSSGKHYTYITYKRDNTAQYNDFSQSSSYFPGQIVYCPVAVFKHSENGILTNPYIKCKSDREDIDFTKISVNYQLKEVFKYLGEYIDMIELTSIIPFIDSGVISEVDEVNKTFTLSEYFRLADLGISDYQNNNTPIINCPSVIIANYFNIGSAQRFFSFSQNNLRINVNEVPKIFVKNELKKFVVECNRYPYKYNGLQISSSDYPFISTEGKADYSVGIRGTALGFNVCYNVISNGKELNPGITANFPSKDIFYIPIYGDNFINFMIGNNNQLNNHVNQVQVAGIEKTALGTIASVIGVMTGNPYAVVGGALSAFNSYSGAIAELINAQNNVDSKIEDAKNLLNSLKGNNNGFSSIFTANIPLFYEASVFDDEEVDSVAFEVYTKGSMYNGIDNIKNIVQNGKYYNYIQTNVEILPFNSVDKISLAELTNIFNKGVRIWNINEAEYTKGSSSEIFIDETFATMNLLIFNYREKEN